MSTDPSALKGVAIAVRISPSTSEVYETERQAPSMVKEFRDFLLRGNLVELAVAFVMGLAFAALVASFVDDLRHADHRDDHRQAGLQRACTFTINDAVFPYGAFITAAITFLATAAAIFFFVVKPVNAIMARTTKPAEDEVTDEERRHQELLAALEGLRR